MSIYTQLLTGWGEDENENEVDTTSVYIVCYDTPDSVVDSIQKELGYRLPYWEWLDPRIRMDRLSGGVTSESKPSSRICFRFYGKVGHVALQIMSDIQSRLSYWNHLEHMTKENRL